ncbi:MAG: AHH domain-containing protein [Planctomycetota bacterium]
MPELGELVSPPMMDDDELQCPFEHDKPGKVKNDLSNSPANLRKRLENGWSTKLWNSEGDQIKPAENQKLLEPRPEEECPAGPVNVDGNEYPYSRSAHHLIPADAALPKSPLIEFMKEGKKVFGDVGYDINGAENGIWLPTHHALSTEMKEGRVLPGEDVSIKYGGLTKKVKKEKQENPMFATFQQRFAYNVMKKTNRQFHDSHPAYSDFVIEVLKKINANLIQLSGECKKCEEVVKQNGKLAPNHKLVSRLNALSCRLRNYLSGPPEMWRLPLFTSRFAAELAEMAQT